MSHTGSQNARVQAKHTETAHYVGPLTAPGSHPHRIYYTNFLHALLFYPEERDSGSLGNREGLLLNYRELYFSRQ